MSRIINPHNIVAFRDVVDETDRGAPLLCGSNLLPFQVKRSSVPSSVSAAVCDLNGNELYTIPSGGLIESNVSGGPWWVTYRGTGLSSTPDEGLYRVHLDIDSTTYFSHAMCVDSRFNQQAFSLFPQCTGTGSTYEITLSFSGTYYGEPAVFADFGDGFTQLGTNTGSFDQDDVTGSGDVTIPVKLQVYNGSQEYFLQWDLNLNTASGCSTMTPSYVGQGGSGVENIGYMSFRNVKDLQGMGLLYQSSYTQQFYFESYEGFPTPVLETEFRRNGENLEKLREARMATQRNLDVYPVPDYLVSTLGHLCETHDTIRWNTLSDGEAYTAYKPTFTPSQVAKAQWSKGTFSFEDDRAYVGKQVNYSLV